MEEDCVLMMLFNLYTSAYLSIDFMLLLLLEREDAEGIEAVVKEEREGGATPCCKALIRLGEKFLGECSDT